MFGAVLYIAQDTASPGHGAALSGDALAVVVALGAACYLVAFKACFAGMTAREFLDFQACRGAVAVGAIVFIAVPLVQKGGGEGGLSNRSFEGENHLSKKDPFPCRAGTCSKSAEPRLGSHLKLQVFGILAGFSPIT